MSYVGKNIKKIRSVKNLNQTKFAELFDLKRASIGAYEEGRAEPKIGTITEIAKYFGITIDDLLNKELSVNDLYHFDIFQKDYVKNKGHQLKPSKLSFNLSPVFYILESKRQAFFDGEGLDSFIRLNLPLVKMNSDYLAFEASAGSVWLNARGETVELLICRVVERVDLASFKERSLLVWDGNHFQFGLLQGQGKELYLREYRHGEIVKLNLKEEVYFLALYELANSLSKLNAAL